MDDPQVVIAFGGFIDSYESPYVEVPEKGAFPFDKYATRNNPLTDFSWTYRRMKDSCSGEDDEDDEIKGWFGTYIG